MVNDFRRQKMLLKRSKTMFWRCLNRSGNSASICGLSACVVLENTLKKNKTIFDGIFCIFIIRPETSNPRANLVFDNNSIIRSQIDFTVPRLSGSGICYISQIGILSILSLNVPTKNCSFRPTGPDSSHTDQIKKRTRFLLYFSN